MLSAGKRPPRPGVKDFCEAGAHRAHRRMDSRRAGPAHGSPNGHEILGWPEPAPIRRSGIQRRVSYLVRSMRSGNVRVPIRVRFT
jgi:hypothetical protein